MSEFIKQHGAVAQAEAWGVAVTPSQLELATLGVMQEVVELPHPVLEVMAGDLGHLQAVGEQVQYAVQEQAAITELINLFGVPEDLLVRPAFMALAAQEARIRLELQRSVMQAQELARQVREKMQLELKNAAMQELQAVREEIEAHRLSKQQSKEEVAEMPLLSKLSAQNATDIDDKITQLKAQEVLLVGLATEIIRSTMTVERARQPLSMLAGQSVAPVTANRLMFAN